MFNIFKDWYQQYFSDPQAIYLFLIILFGFVFVLSAASILAPVFTALVLAYLLDGVIMRITRAGIPRSPVFYIVFIIFIAITTITLITLPPILWQQLKQLFKELPAIAEHGKAFLMSLSQNFPDYFSEQHAEEFISTFQARLSDFGQKILSVTFTSLPDFAVGFIYAILVPLLMFFFLKDKTKLKVWFDSFLPKDRHLAIRVWEEVDDQLGNFVKGKALEVVIVSIATYVVFAFMDLKYAALLAFLVGLSVLVPYIGAAVVTVPVALVAFFQYGWSAEFAYLIIGYTVVQALDGNVLVPILFSEAVNMHPIAIVVSVMFFGGIWGFWGVFFAIPLAILIKAVLNAWPREEADLQNKTV